jgi:DNA-binding response OmpR family regulator
MQVMTAINIVITDDMEDIHKDLRNTLNSINFDYKIIGDFYETSSLIDFFVDMKEADENFDAHVEGVDVLILDYDFGGTGESGLQALPTIREIVPNLPIIFLTTFEDTIFEEAADKYNVEYIRKPVKAADLRFRIRTTIKRTQQWDELKKEMYENKEFMDEFSDKYDKMECDNYEMQEKVISIESERVEKRLPMKMQELIQNIFPDVEFRTAAFRYMVRKEVEQGEWNRLFRTLKTIDWKKENEAGSGEKIQPFSEAKKYGLKNVWEYRFSQEGRIFVQRLPNHKPLILLLDPHHYYSDRGIL